MYHYTLFKKFYVNKEAYAEFCKIVFIEDELGIIDNCIYCVCCGNNCGFKKLCYNKSCYRFINEFSYNESGKRLHVKEILEISSEENKDKEEIELCVGIKKNADLNILNDEIELNNFMYNEYILCCYLKGNSELCNYMDIGFDEILKFLPPLKKKYTLIKILNSGEIYT